MNLRAYVKPYVKNGVVYIDRQFINPTHDYQVPLEQIKTLKDLIRKQEFLSEKSWYSNKINDDFFEVVVYAKGWQQ